mgnify:CR=1 FL=1|jgi:hypothetical protein
MIEFLFIVLGVAVGFNLRREWNQYKENLVLSQVDARVRQELEVARNLNQSLLADLADLKQRMAHIKASVGEGTASHL